MFDVAAEAYDAFMGRYSTPLAPRFCDFAGIGSERRVLDVGCGPGALITELVGRLGSAGVSAVTPCGPEATDPRSAASYWSGVTREMDVTRPL